MMWNFLRGGATVIPGATFIPESRVKKNVRLWSRQKTYRHLGGKYIRKSKKLLNPITVTVTRFIFSSAESTQNPILHMY